MDKYLIDKHKLYWHLDRVSTWQEKRFIPPIYIEISPVDYCNHKCVFCGIDFAMEKKNRLDTEVLSKRLKEMGGLGVKSVMFAGEGEPLLHEDFAKLAKIAKDSCIDVSLTTNGSVDNLKLWEEILPYLTWARFSVDAGTPEVYARVHNVPLSSFDRTLSTIRQAVKIKKARKLDITIGVQFLVIEENLSDVENAIKLFSGLGADYISLKPYSLHPQMKKKKDVIYTKETMRRLDEVVNKYRKNSAADISFRKDAMSKYLEGNKTFNHCRALPFWGYISSKGDFYTCSVFIGDERFRVGNIYRDDMDSIINGDSRKRSIEYGEKELSIGGECRLNCRMARVNDFLEFLENRPMHINFI